MSKDDMRLFDARPHRMKTCPRCKGHGDIRDPYALAPGFVEGAPPDAVHAVVIGASDIFTACREAVTLAASAKRPVAFLFNGPVVVVRETDDPDKVARSWWQQVNGETPEETAARS